MAQDLDDADHSGAFGADSDAVDAASRMGPEVRSGKTDGSDIGDAEGVGTDAGGLGSPELQGEDRSKPGTPEVTQRSLGIAPTDSPGTHPGVAAGLGWPVEPSSVAFIGGQSSKSLDRDNSSTISSALGWPPGTAERTNGHDDPASLGQSSGAFAGSGGEKVPGVPADVNSVLRDGAPGDETSNGPDSEVALSEGATARDAAREGAAPTVAGSAVSGFPARDDVERGGATAGNAASEVAARQDSGEAGAAGGHAAADAAPACVSWAASGGAAQAVEWNEDAQRQDAQRQWAQSPSAQAQQGDDTATDDAAPSNGATDDAAPGNTANNSARDDNTEAQTDTKAVAGDPTDPSTSDLTDVSRETLLAGPTRARANGGDEGQGLEHAGALMDGMTALTPVLPTQLHSTPLPQPPSGLTDGASSAVVGRRISLAESGFPAPSHTRVMTVANQKGGVGKTTTVVNVGAALAQAGLRVLVIDLDPQGNASTALGVEHHVETDSVYDVLVDDVPLEKVVVEAPAVPNLFCAPSTIDLAGAEIELVSLVARETRLAKALNAYLATASYDYVFIDCPPSLGLLTINAFVAAREVFIPIQCEYYALEGLSQLLKSVDMIRTHLNPELVVSTILLTMYDGRTRLSAQVADEVRKHFPEQTLRTTIPRSVRVSEAPSFGETVMTYDPVSIGALAYLEAASQVAANGSRQLAREGAHE